VVWDNIGNVLYGVRPWERWEPRIPAQLLAEDADAVAHAPSFEQIFADYEVELTWLYNPAKAARGFVGFFQERANDLCEVRSLDDVAAALVDADFVVVHKEELPAEALRGARRLRLLQHLGQDYRGIPIATARAMSVPVAATPLVNYLTVAEHVWAFILNHAKQLPGQRAHMQRRAYVDNWGTLPNLKPVRDLTLGLLGMGEIARPIARVAQAFEMPTLYWDIVRFPEIEERYNITYVEWDELFRRADVLSVQLALNDQTQGIIGEREIGLMRPSALFVNTARGKLVDQAALVRALRERRIGGAALDVYAVEPLPVDDPLHALHEDLSSNVTLTPHSAWQSPWTWIRDSQTIWFNVLRSLRGEPVLHRV
jgi:phosphoglycerate dehydrogenase-like enzyme